MGLKITKSIRYAVSMQVLVPMGDNMSAEQIIDRLERELGANWDDSTDIYERV